MGHLLTMLLTAALVVVVLLFVLPGLLGKAPGQTRLDARGNPNPAQPPAAQGQQDALAKSIADDVGAAIKLASSFFSQSNSSSGADDSTN